MKRLQLCLLAVFMLLVSNCVAGSGTVQLTDDQKETPLGTGESLTGKELTTQTGDEKGVQEGKGEKTDETGSTKQLAPQDEAHKLEPGASGPETKNAKKDTQTEGNPSHGAPVLGGDGKDQKKEGLTPQSAPAAEDDTTKTQLDTDLSAAGKNATLTTDGEQVAKKVTEGQNSDGAASTKQLNPQDDAQKGKPGAPGHATGSSTTESQSGVKTPESVPGLGDDGKDQKTEGLTPQGAPFTAGAAKEPKSKEDTSESSPATEGDTKETKAKDEHSKSAPATKDGVSDPKTGGKPSQDAPVLEGAAKDQTKGESPKKNAPATENTNTVPKAKDDTSKSAPATKDSASDPKTGGNPSEGAPVVAGTTAAPVAEGKPTEGNSGSASTSTHIPTDPAKGADSQASVKAGVLSFILSIGTVLAVFA